MWYWVKEKVYHALLIVVLGLLDMTGCPGFGTWVFFLNCILLSNVMLQDRSSNATQDRVLSFASEVGCVKDIIQLKSCSVLSFFAHCALWIHNYAIGFQTNWDNQMLTSPKFLRCPRFPLLLQGKSLYFILRR